MWRIRGNYSKNVLVHLSMTAKITAVKSSDNSSIWIITHTWNSNTFLAYKFKSSGLDTNAVISNTGAIITGSGVMANGYLKASPDNKKTYSLLDGPNWISTTFRF